MLHSVVTKQQGQSADGQYVCRVRLYIVVPLALLILPAVVEFVWLVRANVELNSAAARAAEVAKVGGTPDQLRASLSVSCDRIDWRRVTFRISRQSADDLTHGSTAWRVLGVSGPQNDAMPGEQIRVEVGYSHQLLVGHLSGFFLGADESNQIPLEARAEVLRR